jgi:hypothetical protein
MRADKEREHARKQLLDNARSVSQRWEQEGAQLGKEPLTPVRANDTDFVPAYIPYIGDEYFGQKTQGCRILVYAMSQNMKKDDGFVKKWADDWSKGGTRALDRQNAAYVGSIQKGKPRSVAMEPFDTGHIPALAGILRCQHGSHATTSSIYPQIAVTNLSKMSFRTASGHTTDKADAMKLCWDELSVLEVKMLKPDFIICCGGMVSGVIKRGIADLADLPSPPKVIQVAFPSLRVINRYYRKDIPPLEERDPLKKLKECFNNADLSTPVKKGKTLGAILERDVSYFWRMRGKDYLGDG